LNVLKQRHKDFEKILNRNGISLNDVYLNARGYLDGIYAMVNRVNTQGVILDFGCGTGYISSLLSIKNKVYGIDVANDEENIEVFKNNISVQKSIWNELQAHLSFYDGKILPYKDGFFDAVVCHASLEHVTDLRLSLSEINRVLKNNGKLFIYRLPIIKSYSEKITKAHKVKYSQQGISKLIYQHNFLVNKIEYSDFMFWSVPKLQLLWNLLYPINRVVDLIMLNTRLCEYSHNINLEAYKI
jgi:ubiquinone/menaquinone biosynthesis C-methylase UbiE